MIATFYNVFNLVEGGGGDAYCTAVKNYSFIKTC